MWVGLAVVVFCLLVATAVSLGIDRAHDRIRRQLASAPTLFESDEVSVALAGRAMGSRSMSWKKGAILVTEGAAVLFPQGLVFKQQPIVLLRHPSDQPGASGLATIRIVVVGTPARARTVPLGAPAVVVHGVGPASSKWSLTIQAKRLEELMAALESLVSPSPTRVNMESGGVEGD